MDDEVRVEVKEDGGEVVSLVRERVENRRGTKGGGSAVRVVVAAFGAEWAVDGGRVTADAICGQAARLYWAAMEGKGEEATLSEGMRTRAFGWRARGVGGERRNFTRVTNEIEYF